MKKSLYMWLYIVGDEDMQSSVVVSMSSMTLHLFDLKSLVFVQFATDYLFRKTGYNLVSVDEFNVRLMINVSSHKDVKVALYIDNKCEGDAPLCEIVSEYGKPIDGRVYFSSVDDTPDLLKLLSYFLTEKQIKSSYIQFRR